MPHDTDAAALVHNDTAVPTDLALLGRLVHNVVHAGTVFVSTVSKHRFAKAGYRGTVDAIGTVLSHLHAHTTETLEHLVIALLVYCFVCLGVYWMLHAAGRTAPKPPPATQQQPATPPTGSNNDAANAPPSDDSPALVDPDRATPPPEDDTTASSGAVRFPRLQRILLVTAHPDDESMFFAPTLIALARQRRPRCLVYLLCLSAGNFDRLGAVRREELWRACARLGIPAAHIVLVQSTRLPDDPQALWRAETVAKLIGHHAAALDVDAVCTFDRDGVSGHANHRAIYYACTSLLLADQMPARCRLLALDSTNVLRKYAGVLDLLVTLALASDWVVAGLADVVRARQAMAEHRSQMVWFRWLYVLFSRYMWMNSWREVRRSDVELEMQIDGMEAGGGASASLHSSMDGDELGGGGAAAEADDLYEADGGQAELVAFVE